MSILPCAGTNLAQVTWASVDVEELTICPGPSTSHSEFGNEAFDHYRDCVRAAGGLTGTGWFVKRDPTIGMINIHPLSLFVASLSLSTMKLKSRSTMLSRALGPQRAETDARLDVVPGVRIWTVLGLQVREFHG